MHEKSWAVGLSVSLSARSKPVKPYNVHIVHIQVYSISFKR